MPVKNFLQCLFFAAVVTAVSLPSQAAMVDAADAMLRVAALTDIVPNWPAK